MDRMAVRAAALVLGLGPSGRGLASDDYDPVEESYADAGEMGEPSAERPTSIPTPLTLYGGVRLGVGGEVNYDPGGTDDLVASLGLQVGADYVLMPYFALGGELRLGAFGTDYYDDRGDGRSLLFDFVVRPRGRYVFEGRPLEVFATLPMGLSVPSIDDDWSADGRAGFTLGFGAGANYFFRERLGIGGELLYLHHWIGVESSVAGGTVSRPDSDLSLGQVNFVANLIYAL